MKLKYLIYTFAVIVFLHMGAYAQNMPNAITKPTNTENLTPVNLRSGPSATTECLGTVDMYKTIHILSNTNGFYLAEVICSDNIARTGYIYETYVKKFENIGTAYTINPTNDKYNMTDADMLVYPSKKSKIIKSISRGENVNVYFEANGYTFCESNGKYGYIASEYLAQGFNTLLYNSFENSVSMNDIYMYALNDCNIMTGDKFSKSRAPVIQHNGSSMMPVANIEDFSWGKVSWDETEKCAVAKIGKNTIKIKANSNSININGKDTATSAPSFIKDGRMYVHIRAITDIMGLKIYYSGNSKPFILTKKELDYDSIKQIIYSTADIYDKSAEVLIWPVPTSAGMSSGYGDNRGHRGIDITGKENTPIVAAADGTVTQVVIECPHNYPKKSNCCSTGYGNYVVITHNRKIDGKKVKTRYSHLTSACVSDGQKVSAGDTIAYMGNTGYSTGCHLDFEVILDGVHMDPGNYISVPARLYDSGGTPQFTQPYIDNLLKTRPLQ